MDDFYYLHTDGSLIYKRTMPEADSPFVRKVWTIDLTDRETAWNLLLEALALGADRERVKELAAHWDMTFEDSREYLVRGKPTVLRREGLRIFVEVVFGMSEAEYFKRMREAK